MRALQRDRRGFPVPFIVLRDRTGVPLFAVNDNVRHDRAIRENRCPICGSKLDRVKWLVGGPLSAFHPQGAYIDSALHHECMQYAMRVCPYLAAPSFAGHVDATSPGVTRRVPEGMMTIDTTSIPGRPEVFVAVATHRQEILESRLDVGVGEVEMLHVRPARPYLKLEFWRHGHQIIPEEFGDDVQAALQHLGLKPLFSITDQ